MYWRGAALTAVSSALAVAATLPVARLMDVDTATISRLRFSSVRGGLLGLRWDTDALSPADLQHQALATMSGVLLTVGLGVLLVAMVTVLSVAAARAAQRAPEIQIRRAVGASRRMLRRTAVVEAGLVCGIAIIPAIPVGIAIGWVMRSQWPGTIAPGSLIIPFTLIVIVCAGITIGTLFTLIPARSQQIGETPAKPIALHAAALQLGLSLIVLATAGAVGLAARRTLPANDAAATVLQVDSALIDPAARTAQYSTLLTTLQARDFQRVALVSPGAVSGLGVVNSITAECDCNIMGMYTRLVRGNATHHFVSGDSFAALGIELVAGRTISDHDDAAAPRVAVINQYLSDHLFRNGDAIGRRLRVDGSDDWYTVVGVVTDAPDPGFGGSSRPANTVYLSALQVAPSSIDVIVRGGQLDVTPPVLDPHLSRSFRHVGVIALDRVLAADRAPAQWLQRWMNMLGIAMLGIAAGGVFMLMQLWIGAITPELGLRRAVGVRRGALMAWIVLRAGIAGAAGIAIAAWFGWSLRDPVELALGPLPGWDWTLLRQQAMLLVSMAVAGALLPAWRISRASPALLVAAADE